MSNIHPAFTVNPKIAPVIKPHSPQADTHENIQTPAHIAELGQHTDPVHPATPFSKPVVKPVGNTAKQPDALKSSFKDDND